MREYDTNNLFKCRVFDLDLEVSVYTVVYRIKDVYYDMRLIGNSFDLSAFGRLDNRLYYRTEKTRNLYYGTDRVLLFDSLQPFYGDDKETFNIKELIIDMVDDQDIFTDWPGFSTYLEHQKRKILTKK